MSARYGEEVRDSIHDSIEAMNNQIENELGGMIEEGNDLIEEIQTKKENGDFLMKPGDLTEEQWNKVKTNLTNYYKRYEKTYKTTVENESNIEIGISQYNEGSLLEVYVEGRILNKDEYTINGTNSITLTTPLSEIGTEVLFVVYRSMCATTEDIGNLKGDKGDSRGNCI